MNPVPEPGKQDTGAQNDREEEAALGENENDAENVREVGPSSEARRRPKNTCCGGCNNSSKNDEPQETANHEAETANHEAVTSEGTDGVSCFDSCHGGQWTPPRGSHVAEVVEKPVEEKKNDWGNRVVGFMQYLNKAIYVFCENNRLLRVCNTLFINECTFSWISLCVLINSYFVRSGTKVLVIIL